MPHGDFSDYMALFTFVTGTISMIAPWLWFASIGPVEPMFKGESTDEALYAVQFSGGLLNFMAPTLFVVRWNALNGKAAALGCWTVAANTLLLTLRMDGFAFVLRGWYLFVVMFAYAGYHLAFKANPMLTSAMLLEKEKEKAAKATAAKAAAD